MSHIYIIQNNLKDDSIFIERVKSLGSWLKYFPNSIILKSELSAKEIYEKLSIGFETDWILITEFNKASYWGMLPKVAWEWINKID
jgi:hypothetical protein